MIDEQTVVHRKQSASDLQSRLKTRKLLGVGELARDNGDIYKSKISQLLGINENLYVRLPRGLLYWNTLTALYLYVFGIMGIITPTLALRLDYGLEVKSDESTFIARIYGSCLISFGILFRSILSQRENRSEIAVLLLVTALLQTLQLSVTLVFGQQHLFPCLIRTAGIVGNLTYHNFVDSQGGVHRYVLRAIEDCSVLSANAEQREAFTEKKPMKRE